MGRFFPKIDFESVLLNAVEADNASYNQHFSYPLGGAEEFINVLEHHAQKNCEIRKNTEVVSIDMEHKTVLLDDGKKVQYEFLVNTVPFDRFCSMAGICALIMQIFPPIRWLFST